jgi:hypothetical protein
MNSQDIKAEFAGFGPIPSSKTTFAQGIGLGGSFAPIWTTDPVIPPKIPSSQQVINYPFKISSQEIDHQFSILVFADSYLFDSNIDSSNPITIDNLDTNINCNNNDYVWLEIDISSSSVTYATIKTVGSGGTFTGGGIWQTNGNLEDDGNNPPNQIYARKLLAYVNNKNIQPIVVTNLGMAQFCANGIPAIFPVPI